MTNLGLFLINGLVASFFTLICARQGQVMLSVWVAMQGILANIFVLKQIMLFGLNVTASDVFAISSMLSVTLLQEFHGKDQAKLAVKSACIGLFFFALIAQLHLHYVPSPADYAQPAYITLFGPNFRIILASIASYALCQQVNIRLFSLLSLWKGWLALPVRLGISISFSQILDTCVFALLGLWGLVSNLSQIIFFSALIKLLSIALLTPISHIMKRYESVFKHESSKL